MSHSQWGMQPVMAQGASHSPPAPSLHVASTHARVRISKPRLAPPRDAPSTSNYSYATTRRLGDAIEPPPPSPMNWGLMVGWVAVVAAAAGIFYGVTQEGPWFALDAPRRNGKRRRSSRLRANVRRKGRRGLRRVSRNGRRRSSRMAANWRWPWSRKSAAKATHPPVASDGKREVLRAFDTAYWDYAVGPTEALKQAAQKAFQHALAAGVSERKLLDAAFEAVYGLEYEGVSGEDFGRRDLWKLRGGKRGTLTGNRRARLRANYHGTAAQAAMRMLDAPRTQTGKVRTSRGVLKITSQRGAGGRPGGIRISRNATRGTKRKVSAVMKAAGGIATVRNLGVSGAPAASKLGQKRYDMLVRRGPGLYRISAGRSPSIIKFKTASPQGAITNTRIASSASGESHWLVKVFPSGRPKAVVIRYITGDGKTKFRVEEYAAEAFARVAGYGRRAG